MFSMQIQLPAFFRLLILHAILRSILLQLALLNDLRNLKR